LEVKYDKMQAIYNIINMFNCPYCGMPLSVESSEMVGFGKFEATLVCEEPDCSFRWKMHMDLKEDNIV